MRFCLAALLVAAAAGGAWAASAGGTAVGARRTGDLLAVDGSVLRRGAFLQLDRMERTVRTVAPAALRVQSNPQFEVELIPGRSIDVRGAVSRKLVSSRFVPSGPPRLDRAVALTFDDGPSQYTARFVALLEALRVPATFFVVGTQAEERPDLVRLEADAGFAIGNHSYSHPWRTPFAGLQSARILAEIDRGEAVLQRLGVRTGLFRPPGGTFSSFVIRAARAKDERIALWSVDARDWEAGSTPDQIAERVLDAVQAGSIVVMHDGGGNREATLAALPRIVAGIRARGLAFVALGPTG